MVYTTTMTVLTHTLPVTTDTWWMRTENVSCLIVKNDLSTEMWEWLCTSKSESTLELETHSWDDTLIYIWHRITVYDRILNIQLRKNGDPQSMKGISFVTSTRHQPKIPLKTSLWYLSQDSQNPVSHYNRNSVNLNLSQTPKIIKKLFSFLFLKFFLYFW